MNILKTKKQLQARIAELEADIENMNDNYISSDSVSDLISEAIKEHEEQKILDLCSELPESNRRNFKIIQGAA